MSVRLLLFVCSLCVLSCGPAAFITAGAEEESETTKRTQKVVANVVSMQYAMQSNANSLASFLDGAQRAISVESQQRWGLGKWEAERGVKRANQLTDSAYSVSKYVNESAYAIRDTVAEVLSALQAALKNTDVSEAEKAKMKEAETLWQYGLNNVSVQLTVAENVSRHAEQAKAEMNAAAEVTKEKLGFDRISQEIKDALAKALQALEGPARQAEELASGVFKASLLLWQAQEVTRGLKLPEEKLQVVETLKEELEKKTVDGLKTNGTLELDKVQRIMETEGNTTANVSGAGVSQDALSVEGGLPATFQFAALLVPFVLAIAAAAMTAA